MLKQSGFIDALPAANQRKIKRAKDAYRKRLRENFNAELEADLSSLGETVSQGIYTPTEVVKLYSDVYAKHDMEMFGAEANAAYQHGAEAASLYEQGNAVLYANALALGDFDALLAISSEAMIWVESKGNPYAVGPMIHSGMNAGDRALGPAQVMPKTLKNPGYGVTPARSNTPEEYERVGRDYWRAMLMGNAGHASLPGPMGDI